MTEQITLKAFTTFEPFCGDDVEECHNWNLRPSNDPISGGRYECKNCDIEMEVELHDGGPYIRFYNSDEEIDTDIDPAEVYFG